MSHRIPTDKDRAHPVDPDASGYWPERQSLADRDRREAAWVAAVERLKASAPRSERRVANVREASTVARWVVLVGGTILALLAVVGVAVLWGDA